MATCVRQCKCCWLRRSECGRSKKKIWLDIKVEAKKRLASHRQTVCAIGWETGQPELTLQDENLARIIGESLLNGVVKGVEGDTDAGPQEAEDCNVCNLYSHI